MIISIQELLDNAIAPDPKPRERSGKYVPSSLGKCYRAQVWNRANFPISNPPDKRVNRVFKVGDLFHEFVQDTLLKNYSDLRKEVKVEDKDFFGFADLVNGNEVFDIKSQHSKAFHYMAKSKNIKKDKKPQFLQVSLYADRLKKEFVRLVFISKDDLCVAEFQFPLSDFKPELDKEVAELREAWKKYQGGVLPPAKPRAYGGKKECEYCNWRDACKKKEEENVAK